MNIQKTQVQKKPSKFEDNFSKEKPEDPGIPKKNLKKEWEENAGEFSEVMDSEGHRLRINHY